MFVIDRNIKSTFLDLLFVLPLHLNKQTITGFYLFKNHCPNGLSPTNFVNQIIFDPGEQMSNS